MKGICIFYLVLIMALTCFFPGFSQDSAARYLLTSEEQLTNPVYQEKILQFYESGQEVDFSGAAQVNIYGKYFRRPAEEKGAVVLSTGRTEGAVKYAELIFDLYNNGYSVYIHDHRGQGFSGRMAADPEMGHVDNFQYYIDDLKAFHDRYVAAGNHSHVFLLAHSMGGTIGMSYIEQHPGDFDAAVFSSPMLGLSAYICPLAKLLSGKTIKYAPGQTGYTNDSTDFQGNSVTGSVARYHFKIGVYENHPKAKVGGPSVQWLEQSCKQMKRVFREVENIEIPCLVFSADNETVVNPKAFGKFVSKATKKGVNIQLIPVESAKHELLMEKDLQRNLVLEQTIEFFGQNR